jgi:hydroxymethylbilane synthase
VSHPSPLKIGSRGSPLALAQTALVRRLLAVFHPLLAEDGAVEVVVIQTSGDRIVDRPLADVGGKGLFTKEIDLALQAGAIDLAVHSVKDLPTVLADGLVLAAVPPREDPRDAFIGRTARSLDALPASAVIGTASLRRQAQILGRRPDLEVVPLRGNVETRLRKVADGEVDATLLALAGLKRLQLTRAVASVLDVDAMLPAVGQGAIGITARADAGAVLALLAAVDDAATHSAVTAERAMLERLDGSCRTPIAGLATADGGGGLDLRGLVASADGRTVLTARGSGAAGDARRLGLDVGDELRRRGGDAVWRGQA